MKKTYPELPNWTFELDEVSAGVYEVVARDNFGHEISEKGIDVVKIIESCRRQALEILNG